MNYEEKIQKDEDFKQALAGKMREVYAWKDGKKDERWRAAAGIAYSEVYEYVVVSSLERVNIAIDLHGIIGKLTSARHAGLSNEQLGAIFCREYDNLRKASE